MVVRQAIALDLNSNFHRHCGFFDGVVVDGAAAVAVCGTIWFVVVAVAIVCAWIA